MGGKIRVNLRRPNRMGLCEPPVSIQTRGSRFQSNSTTTFHPVDASHTVQSLHMLAENCFESKIHDNFY